VSRPSCTARAHLYSACTGARSERGGCGVRLSRHILHFAEPQCRLHLEILHFAEPQCRLHLCEILHFAEPQCRLRLHMRCSAMASWGREVFRRVRSHDAGVEAPRPCAVSRVREDVAEGAELMRARSDPVDAGALAPEASSVASDATGRELFGAAEDLRRALLTRIEEGVQVRRGAGDDQGPATSPTERVDHRLAGAAALLRGQGRDPRGDGLCPLTQARVLFWRGRLTVHTRGMDPMVAGMKPAPVPGQPPAPKRRDRVRPCAGRVVRSHGGKVSHGGQTEKPALRLCEVQDFVGCQDLGPRRKRTCTRPARERGASVEVAAFASRATSCTSQSLSAGFCGYFIGLGRCGEAASSSSSGTAVVAGAPSREGIRKISTRRFCAVPPVVLGTRG